MTFKPRGDTRVTSRSDLERANRKEGRTDVRARTRALATYTSHPRGVFIARSESSVLLVSHRGCVAAALSGCGRRSGTRDRRNRGDLPESTHFSLSLCPFLSLSLSLPLHSERALDSSSKERRVVDHRYGEGETRKWPTVGRRVLHAGKGLQRAFRASRVSQ